MVNIDEQRADDSPIETASAEAMAVEPTPANVVHDFEFRGTAAEYFKIWLVNTALTVLTVGIYSAWAKVRTTRYFYANTFLGGANFDYHASPVSILVSRAIVFAIIIGGGYWADISDADLVYSLVLLIFLPWALVRGLSFNARNSSFCRVRFYFRRGYTLPYLYYFLMISGIGFLVLPWLVRRYHQFKASRHQFGKLRFVFNQPSIWFYIAIFWLMPLMLGLMIALGYLWVDSDNDALMWAAVFIATLGVIYIFKARTWMFLLFWNNIRTENGAVFCCNFSAREFAYKILAVNFIAVILSVGLLHPWAKIRKTKFLATRMTIVAPPGVLDNILAQQADEEGALGEEFDAAEGFDFDVGLV